MVFRLGGFFILKNKQVLSLLGLVGLCGCAGPSTPFGALKDLKLQSMKFLNLDKNIEDITEKGTSRTGAQIRFFPSRQNLHSRTPLTIVVKDIDHIPTPEELIIRYNGLNVTETFLAQADIKSMVDKKKLKIKFPVLRLPPDRENKIEVIYRKNSATAYAQYLPPQCAPYDQKRVISTIPFQAPSDLMGLISRVSRKNSYNPSFVTGIIAQESGFNSKAVSFSKAIGLTQITSIAEQEILKKFPDWPRYPEINGIPLPILKSKIWLGQIHGKNEWRLDPYYSIRGGLAYLKYIETYWKHPEVYKKISPYLRNSEEGVTQLVLASYNSGITRVSQALERSGKNWLYDNDLKAARRYVNRIVSYCYHFSNMEGENDDET